MGDICVISSNSINFWMMHAWPLNRWWWCLVPIWIKSRLLYNCQLYLCFDFKNGMHYHVRSHRIILLLGPIFVPSWRFQLIIKKTSLLRVLLCIFLLSLILYPWEVQFLNLNFDACKLGISTFTRDILFWTKFKVSKWTYN